VFSSWIVPSEASGKCCATCANAADIAESDINRNDGEYSAMIFSLTVLDAPIF
jgi:hypothetical protein